MCLLVLWMIFTLNPVFTAVLVLFTAINMRLFQYLVNKSQNYCRILQYCTKIIFYSLSLKWKHTYCIFVNFKIKLNEYCCVVTSENSRWWQGKKASHEHVNAVNSTLPSYNRKKRHFSSAKTGPQAQNKYPLPISRNSCHLCILGHFKLLTLWTGIYAGCTLIVFFLNVLPTNHTFKICKSENHTFIKFRHVSNIRREYALVVRGRY